jgi:hypothetical protein
MSRRQITSFIPLQPAGRRVEAWPAEPGMSCKQPSWWEPRSPTAPRVEGAGRTVLACPTPSRKRVDQPTRHLSRPAPAA